MKRNIFDAVNQSPKKISLLDQIPLLNKGGDHQILCPKHAKFFLTHICTVQQCAEPLCSMCVAEHEQFHIYKNDKSQIISIFQLRDDYHDIVSKELKKLQGELSEFDNLQKSIAGKNSVYDQSLKLLEATRIKLYDIVDEVINELIGHLQNNYSHRNIIKSEPPFTQIENAQIYIENEIKKLNLIYNDLISNQEYIRAIIYCIDRSVGITDNCIIKDLNNKLQLNQEQLNPKIILNENYKLDILKHIQQYVRIDTKEYEANIGHREPDYQQDQDDKNIIENLLGNTSQRYMEEIDNKQILTNSIYLTSKKLLQQKPPIFAHSTNELAQIKSYPPVQIIGQFQIQHLCSLIDDTKTSLYCDINNIHAIQIVQLDLDNRLPHNHQSIILEPYLYFMGGIVRDFHRFHSVSSVYRMHTKTMRIQLIGNMNERRQNFGACSVGVQNIFVVGGSLNEEQSSSVNSCERFDIISKNWTPVAPCLIKSTGCNLIDFREKYLFKIGGLDIEYKQIKIIEVYNIQKDCWFSINIFDANFQNWNLAPNNGGGVVVNDNEILIFGGMVDDQLSDDCWVAEINYLGNQINSLIFRKTHSIPFSGIVKSPVIVGQNRVFAFIQKQDYPQTRKRNIIEYTGDGWNVIA